MAHIVPLSKVEDKIFNLQKNGMEAGLKIGFPNLDSIYSVKAGTSTVIYGRPTSGKSQLYFQMLTSLACQGKKSMLMTPETGSVEEIYAEIIQTLTGKRFHNDSLNYRITEQDLYRVIPFVKDYFYVIDVDEKSPSVDEFIELTKEGIKDHDIFTSGFDNWNDLSHGQFNREDLYIEESIPKINRLARKERIHAFMIWHARNPDLPKNGEPPPPPSPFEIKGGSAVYSKAMNLICVDRPLEKTGEGFKQTNQAMVVVHKFKPKGHGGKGTAKLEFDYFKNCYYENRGERLYLPTPFNGISEVKEQSNNDIKPIEQAPF
jgi:hypothetical protein